MEQLNLVRVTMATYSLHRRQGKPKLILKACRLFHEMHIRALGIDQELSVIEQQDKSIEQLNLIRVSVVTYYSLHRWQVIQTKTDQVN